MFYGTSTSTIRDVFVAVTAHINLIENAYFGLACIVEGEKEFVAMSVRLFALLDEAETGLPPLFFEVEFFLDNVSVLKNRVTRHLYFLQVSKKFLQGAAEIDVDTAVKLASWHMQIHFGNHDPSKHSSMYFKLEDFLPAYIIAADHPANPLSMRLATNHQKAFGLTIDKAEEDYIKASQVPAPSVFGIFHT